jgi:hypothetical protein
LYVTIPQMFVRATDSELHRPMRLDATQCTVLIECVFMRIVIESEILSYL